MAQVTVAIVSCPTPDAFNLFGALGRCGRQALRSAHDRDARETRGAQQWSVAMQVLRLDADLDLEAHA